MKVLQDDVGLGRGHFRTTAEIDDNKLAKFSRVLSNDMHEKILPAGDEEYIAYLGHSLQLLGEGMDHATSIGLEADPIPST